MKIIVEYDEHKKVDLIQCSSRMESFGKGFAALDINQKYLKKISQLSKSIERNSIIELKELGGKLDPCLTENDTIIFAFIGSRQLNPLITHYYNLNRHTISPTSRKDKNNGIKTSTKRYCISCFSENNKTDTLSIIKCVRLLSKMSKELHKSLVIYASSEAFLDMYKFRKSSCHIINHYLEQYSGILVIRSTPIRKSSTASLNLNYPSYIIEDTVGLNVGIKKALSILKSSLNNPNTSSYEDLDCQPKNKNTRQQDTLFTDPFYLSIDPNQEIYVPLLTEASTDLEYYTNLGFEYISLESGLRMLHGLRSNFDRYGDYIRSVVTGEYRLNILTYAPCMRDNIQPTLPYTLPPDAQPYTGKGAYIGIIAADDIDYTNAALRMQDGSTRIAYIWDQVKTTTANAYTAEEINEALASPNPGERIRLPDGESMSTVMAAIAGGWSEALGYRGIAPEAEFLVAKIQPVSAELQRIFGGMPNPKAVAMYDVVIGLLALVNFSFRQGRPLVVIVPFNGNIDPHDSTLYSHQQLYNLSRRVDLTIVVPTGDEANKQHHYRLLGEYSGSQSINLEVSQPNQNVIVVIYQWGGSTSQINLVAPTGDPSINLKTEGISTLGSTTVYSSGENISYLNGTIRTQFRLENPSVGRWRIELNVNLGEANRIDIWMSQEELNPYIRLNPSNALTTMGSVAAVPNIMTVGGYDFNAQVVISSSGRGDPLSSNVVPTLVTYGRGILAPCNSGQWIGLTGTVPATSIMIGIIALIYEKYISSGANRTPNTVVMKSIVISALTQLQNLQYPNPTQGYGIFSLEALSELLDETIR